MRVYRMAIAAMSVAAFAGLAPLGAQTQWQVTKTFPVGGEGGWDYVTVDAANHRFFVTRSTHTQAIDEKTGGTWGYSGAGAIARRSAGAEAGARLSHGRRRQRRDPGVRPEDVWRAGEAGSDAGCGMDHLRREHESGAGGVGRRQCADDLQAGYRTPRAGRSMRRSNWAERRSFWRWMGAGRAYINLEDKDLVAVVDLHTRKVVARWPVAPGGHPVGMAMECEGTPAFYWLPRIRRRWS